MKKNLQLALLSIIPSVLLWAPFIFRMPSFWGIPLPQNGMATIVSNYDGPLYMVVAKTFYNSGLISSNFQFPLPTEYYMAHFPLFPALISIFGSLVNFPYAMLFVTIVTSYLAIYFFHKLTNNIFLTFLFAILPARWLIVRSIGSPEPLFIAGILASIYYFKNEKYWPAGIWGMIAGLTKSPAILLFVSYLVYLIWQKKHDYKKYMPLLLIPLSLFLVFVFYYFRTGDFFAYFNSGDNIHLLFPPFQIFNGSASWVGTFWLEEILFIYALGAGTFLKLVKDKEYLFASFVGVFFLLTLFISHRDLLRYSLPIMPFVILAFKDLLITKEAKYIIGLLIIPIYLYSLSFISQNVMPISNWAPFL